VPGVDLRRKLQGIDTTKLAAMPAGEKADQVAPPPPAT